MKFDKKDYWKIINALDGIRCDNRENRYSDQLRDIEEDVMQYIERKAYCKYIYGANCKFVRTLTEKGYEVLQEMDYGKYRRKKAKENWRLWLPVGISLLSLAISTVFAVITIRKEINKPEIEQKITQLDSLSKSVSDSFHLYQIQMTKLQNPTINPLDTSKLK
jgi:hypothetical protein